MRYFRGEIHETGTCKKYDNRIATEADSFVFTASVLGNIFQQTYNMVDTAIVGQTLGAKALAAVGASTADYAIAMVDEIESGDHIQERISVVRV